MTTTPSSSNSRSAKSALGTSPGRGIHKYMVARGDSQANPAARKAATAASRRALKVGNVARHKRFIALERRDPGRLDRHELPGVGERLHLASAPTRSPARATAQPQRQPVMLYVFDSEWNSIATSRAPSISKMLGGT